MRKSLPALVLLLLFGGCDTSTSKLSAAQESRFQTEGVKRRMDDAVFRYTRDPGGRDERLRLFAEGEGGSARAS